MNLYLPYPEINRGQAKQTDQHINNNAPFANPKGVSVKEGKKNIGRNLMNPHVKEYVRHSSNETTEINGLERISHFLGKKPKKLINPRDGFLELSLHYINN